MKVLIIGLGSIGKRHISVIKKLQPKTTKEEFESYAKLVNSKLNKK